MRFGKQMDEDSNMIQWGYEGFLKFSFTRDWEDEYVHGACNGSRPPKERYISGIKTKCSPTAGHIKNSASVYRQVWFDCTLEEYWWKCSCWHRVHDLQRNQEGRWWLWASQPLERTENLTPLNETSMARSAKVKSLSSQNAMNTSEIVLLPLIHDSPWMKNLQQSDHIDHHRKYDCLPHKGVSQHTQYSKISSTDTHSK